MKKIVKTQSQYDKLVEQKYTGEVYLLVNVPNGFVGINILIGKVLKFMTCECSVYMKNGVIHREKDPAIIHSSLWFISSWYIENGNYVNDNDRPSFIKRSKSDVDVEVIKCYYNDQHELHCDFGPAYSRFVEEKFKTYKFEKYYLEGIEMTKENFCILKDKFILKKRFLNYERMCSNKPKRI